MKEKLVLILIIFVALFLRLWQLGMVPASPDWDEAALGYNAYSILTTGRDEYGKFLPIILRSFDDYKPGLYAYLIVPFINLLGLTVFSVRLPSAIFGVIGVFAAYFLIKELLKDKRIALIGSFLLAISPWHIQFSRIAFEANVGLTLNLLAALFFLLGLKRHWLLLISAFFAGLSLYVYQSEKVFIPLLFLALALVFQKDIIKISKKYLLLAFLVGLLVSLPIVHYTLTNKESLSRAQGVSLFADKTPFLQENVQRLIKDKEKNDTLGLVLDNRRFVYAKAIIAGYLSHFDLNWLFIRGDNPRHHAPSMGLLYLWELPLLLIGIYALIFGKFPKKAKLIIFAWFLVAPIPASITSGVPHAIRTLNFLPTFQIFTAIGIITAMGAIFQPKAGPPLAEKIKYPSQRLVRLWRKRSKFKIKYLILVLYFAFFIFNFLYYLNQYFVQQNYFFSEFWQYGYKEAVEEAKRLEPQYDKIIVSNQPHLDQSYMFFLFYLQYPPALYQKEGASVSGGFRETHKFGKFEFRRIDWEKEEKNPKIMYIGRPEDFPLDVHLIKSIDFLNGKEAIKVIRPR